MITTRFLGQFRLRTLMIFVLLSGMLLGGVSYALGKIRHRQRVTEIMAALKPFNARWAVQTADGRTECNFDSTSYRNAPFFQRWFRHYYASSQVAGCTYFGLEGSSIRDRDLVLIRPWVDEAHVTAIDLSNTQIGDEGLQHLRTHSSLKFLSLDGTRVTDRGLEQLTPLKRLRLVSLNGTQVTIEGIAKLQKELPYCWVQYEAAASGD